MARVVYAQDGPAKFVESAPEIIKQAAQSVLGIFALMILLLGVLGYVYFRHAGEKARLAVFAALFFGVFAFGFAVVQSLESSARKGKPTEVVQQAPIVPPKNEKGTLPKSENTDTSGATGGTPAPVASSGTTKPPSGKPRPVPSPEVAVKAELIVKTVTPLREWIVGTAGSQTFKAEEGTEPYTWFKISSNAPGLDFHPETVTLSGTPTMAGQFSLSIQARDARGIYSKAEVFPISVTPGEPQRAYAGTVSTPSPIRPVDRASLQRYIESPERRPANGEVTQVPKPRAFHHLSMHFSRPIVPTWIQFAT